MWLIEQYPAYDKRHDVLPRSRKLSLNRACCAGRRVYRQDQPIHWLEGQVGLAHLKHQSELDRPRRARSEQACLPGSCEEGFQRPIAIAR